MHRLGARGAQLAPPAREHRTTQRVEAHARRIHHRHQRLAPGPGRAAAARTRARPVVAAGTCLAARLLARGGARAAPAARATCLRPFLLRISFPSFRSCLSACRRLLSRCLRGCRRLVRWHGHKLALHGRRHHDHILHHAARWRLAHLVPVAHDGARGGDLLHDAQDGRDRDPRCHAPRVAVVAFEGRVAACRRGRVRRRARRRGRQLGRHVCTRQSRSCLQLCLPLLCLLLLLRPRRRPRCPGLPAGCAILKAEHEHVRGLQGGDGDVEQLRQDGARHGKHDRVVRPACQQLLQRDVGRGQRPGGLQLLALPHAVDLCLLVRAGRCQVHQQARGLQPVRDGARVVAPCQPLLHNVAVHARQRRRAVVAARADERPALHDLAGPGVGVLLAGHLARLAAALGALPDEHSL
mmetsp:Transcript_31130/g.79362  ORF Transcript_31130/g.79362 Transcript_31130/m.79362 type:complete len:410 (-) Transcript_31130:777-2006(-)